jgi:hypothetical protein
MQAHPSTTNGSPSRLRRLAMAAGVVLVFAVPAALQTMPPPSQLSHEVAPNVGDPLFITWTMGWEAHALVHHPSEVFAGNIFYPRRDAIAWSDSLLVATPVFGLLDAATGGHHIVAYNLLSLIAFAGVGLATYLLARELLADRRGALVAGTLFSLSMARSASVGHLQLSGVAFVALALVALVRFLRHRRWSAAVALGVAAAATWMMTAYYAILLVLVVVPFVVVWLAQRQFRGGPRSLTGLALAAGVAALLSGPTLVPYARLQRAGLFERTPGVQQGVSFADLVRLPSSALYRLFGVGQFIAYGRGALFPGVVLLVLVAIAARWAVKHRGTGEHGIVWPLVAATVLPVCLIFGHTSGVFSLPFDGLRVVVPGVSSLRDLHRFFVFPMMCLALAAGFGAIRLLDALPERRRHAALGVILACAWVELIFRPPLATVDLSSRAVAANEALRSLPAGPVLELPEPIGPKLPFVNAARELRSLVDLDPRVDGYSGNVPSEVQDVEYLASRLTVPELIPVVRGYGVRYLVLHGTARACVAGYNPSEMALISLQLGSTPGVDQLVPAGSDLVVILAPAPIDRRVPVGGPGPVRPVRCTP